MGLWREAGRAVDDAGQRRQLIGRCGGQFHGTTSTGAIDDLELRQLAVGQDSEGSQQVGHRAGSCCNCVETSRRSRAI